MHLVRASAAVAYQPPGHQGVSARRLMGLEAGGPEGFSVAISDYPPGAEASASPVATDIAYVVLEGQLELTSAQDGVTVTLGVQDSVFLHQGEIRSLRNASLETATLLVVVTPPKVAGT